jgi:hypothetical protein
MGILSICTDGLPLPSDARSFRQRRRHRHDRWPVALRERVDQRIANAGLLLDDDQKRKIATVAAKT